MKLEPRILKAIYETVYDIFAYRLGPDEWQEAQNDFQSRLKEELDRLNKNP